jgi:hypothetical protein
MFTKEACVTTSSQVKPGTQPGQKVVLRGKGIVLCRHFIMFRGHIIFNDTSQCCCYLMLVCHHSFTSDGCMVTVFNQHVNEVSTNQKHRKG